MFKYYSRMVGTEYLFHTLARYVAEIEASSRMAKGGTLSTMSLMNMIDNEIIHTTIEMEVDPNKLGDEDQSNVNKLQLMLVVQKIFNAIMKSSTDIPL